MKRKLSKIYAYCLSIVIVNLIYASIPNVYAVSTTRTNSNQDTWITSSKKTPIKIVDGDSLEIGKRRIRLMGIDAPEYNQTCKNEKQEIYSCGKTSMEYLEKLATKNDIRCKIHKQDKYKRDLCTCYSGAEDINAQMIKSGNAIVYLESSYHKEQAYAKKHRQGIWSGTFIHPRLFRLLEEKANKKIN